MIVGYQDRQKPEEHDREMMMKESERKKIMQ